MSAVSGPIGAGEYGRVKCTGRVSDAPTVGGFAAELRDLAERLDLPQPARARLVFELDADLRDMADSLHRRGVPPEEAHRTALETLLPTPDVLIELDALHRPLYLRLVDRFSDPVRHRLERALFGLALITLAVVGTAVLSRFDLLAHPAPFTLPLLGLGVAGLGIGLWSLFQLHVRRTTSAARLSRGLSWLPVIAVAAVVGVLLGLATDLFATADLLTARIAEDRSIILVWLRRDAAMGSVGLLVSALALGAWLWLMAGLARLRLAELDLELNLRSEGVERWN